jgi:hypothetical protein
MPEDFETSDPRQAGPAPTIGNTARREASPWAVLKCKFSDDTSPAPPDDHYVRLFTAAGRGSFNMVDFFLDVSHGKVDVGGSEVFGWYTLGYSRADFAGNVGMAPKGKLNREGLMAVCKQAALDAGVRLDLFAGVVVAMNGPVETFGVREAMEAMCDGGSLKPSLLGQEMGHGYGLEHSRRDGSEEEYEDPWDVMSTVKAAMAPSAEYEDIGPGLNAANMRHVDWLDESRVWKHGAAFDETVELRPLHRPDLDGYLAAELGEFLVEFRAQERWDAEIRRPCVLVHRLEDKHSYLMKGEGEFYDLADGERFQTGPEGLQNRYALEVESIDAEARVARVRLIHQPPPSVPVERGQVFGGVPEDGGGHVSIGGKGTPVPPRGPAKER